MHDNQDPTTALFDLLRQFAPELLPIGRYLVLGPYLATGLLAEHTCAPSVRELVALKRTVERHGPALTPTLARLLDASGRLPAVRIESQLDRLIELDPGQWTHPSEVLETPISVASEMLDACRLRMETASQDDKARLEGVEQKLVHAARLEDTARERREKRRSRGRIRRRAED